MTPIDTTDVVRASVWIRPAGEALESIVKASRLVHKRAGGPEVYPHLTLLKGIETTRANAELKLKHLASRLKPFSVHLGRIAWQRDYFRCLYATVAMNQELAAAQRTAHEVFEMNPPELFEPHVSLLYGSLDEAQQKELAKEAGGSLHVSFEAKAVYLVTAALSVPVAEWRTLAEHPLGG
ncbi:MAG TPA: 2'-5' RNA ligase family protein [Burkholderiales bacterium]|nr:2'-5' RNA ligase family protein [Burkholderiales bacterium]